MTRNPKMFEVPESHLISIELPFLWISRTITSLTLLVIKSGGETSASELEAPEATEDDLMIIL